MILIRRITDFTQRWIVDDNWTYTADITPLTQELSPAASVLLVFYGLDTIANVVSTWRNICIGISYTRREQTVAGHPVAWVNNQFRQYTFDVTDFVVSPVNNDTNVTVAFESAWHYGLSVTARPDAESSPTGDVRRSH